MEAEHHLQENSMNPPFVFLLKRVKLYIEGGRLIFVSWLETVGYNFISNPAVLHKQSTFNLI